MTDSRMASQPHGDLDATNGATEALNRVIDEYLEQRARGTAIDHSSLVEKHPELMPQLGEALRRIDLIDRALDGSLQPGSPATLAVASVCNETPQPTVRCPHCHHLVKLRSIVTRSAATCESCQQQFYLSDLAAEAVPPRRIGRFELSERVGVGGFGAVWRALDRELDRVVAIKVPRQPLQGRELEDFLNEARIAAQLKHPHIVPVYEIGIEAETVYLVSDFVEGVSLEQWIAENSLTPSEAALLVRKLAEAVHAAHECGVIHRDLKPANILMNGAGEPAITDFGLAKRHAVDVTVTLDGRILGTPAYMSPEQAAGRSGEADARSDVYSLGVILFELLTGERPFRGQTAMLLHQVVQDEPPSPRQFNAFVPRDLETIALKCLEKEPEARFDTAGELAAELDRHLSGQPILSRPTARLARVARWCGRNPVVAGAAAAILLLLLALVSAGWWSYFDERQDRREIEAALQQEDLIRQAFLQTSDFRIFKAAVEQAAQDSQLIALARRVSDDRDLSESAAVLRDSGVSASAATRQAAQIELLSNAHRMALQGWLAERAATSGVEVFAWFVLDRFGTQLARSPEDNAFGRNYAWRTYFHGGSRDYRDYSDYRTRAPADRSELQTTYLSRALFTDVTRRYVVVVSTPIVERQEFLGVLGVMVELSVAEE